MFPDSKKTYIDNEKKDYLTIHLGLKSQYTCIFPLFSEIPSKDPTSYIKTFSNRSHLAKYSAIGHPYKTLLAKFGPICISF